MLLEKFNNFIYGKEKRRKCNSKIYLILFIFTCKDPAICFTSASNNADDIAGTGEGEVSESSVVSSSLTAEHCTRGSGWSFSSTLCCWGTFSGNEA